MEHGVDALLCLDAGRFFEFNVFRLFGVAERFENVFKRVRLHVLAHATAADEALVRVFILHARYETAFR